ncbi:MAG: uracil phosphoribosyltransferase [archaeon]
MGKLNNAFDLKIPAVSMHVERLRAPSTDIVNARDSARALGFILAYEMLQYAPTRESRIITRMQEISVAEVPAALPYVVPILRAGKYLAEGALGYLIGAPTGDIGAARSHGQLEDLTADVLYVGLPKDLKGAQVHIYDIMLASGVSIEGALNVVKERNPGPISLGVVIATKPGIERVHKLHPEVPIFYCALDDRLNDIGYILPGLGDAGNIVSGTL